MGIGFAAACECAREGAAVVIAAETRRNWKRARRAEKDILRRPPGLSAGRGDLKQVSGFSSWCAEKLRAVHGLVNCAGIYGPIGKLNDLNLERFSETMQINFMGTVYMCTPFIPCSIPERSRRSSISREAERRPRPPLFGLCGSKAAIVRFTENLSLEWAAAGFEVNCIAPGFVRTRLHQQTLSAGAETAGNAFFENTKSQMESGGVPPIWPRG